MKRILLLGDSIRQNYQEYVKKELEGTAEVSFPNDNGKFGYLTLRYCHEWIRVLTPEGKKPFDIVHFNIGLWDVLRLSNEDRTFTSDEEYALLLRRISDRIRFYLPNAKQIFALSTSVIEPGFEPGELYGKRCNDDIERFNEIAKEVFANTDVSINDLWIVSKRLPDDARSDMVHFDTKEGRETLGAQVAGEINKFL